MAKNDKKKHDIFAAIKQEIDPIVKELLRNSEIDDKTGADPVGQVERSAKVTEGEIKNGLNANSTQAAVIVTAVKDTPNLDTHRKYPPEILEAAELLKIKPEEVTDKKLQEAKELKAKQEEEAKKTFAKVAGVVFGIGAGEAAAFVGKEYSTGNNQNLPNNKEKSKEFDFSFFNRPR